MCRQRCHVSTLTLATVSVSQCCSAGNPNVLHIYAKELQKQATYQFCSLMAQELQHPIICEIWEICDIFMFAVNVVTNPVMKESFYSLLCGLQSKDEIVVCFARGRSYAYSQTSALFVFVSVRFQEGCLHSVTLCSTKATIYF